MMYYAISATKGNRLYWLGRYTERVYISLHLLRRYYDKMIDSPAKEYEGYYQKLDATNPYPDMESFWKGYMYDAANPCSILAGLTSANDNAIVLREEIMSETLSYIQLSLCHIQRSAEKADTNITDLQPITDYLLAFWGSIDERVFDKRIRNFLRIGRLVENIDMHIRFDYPFYRIQEAFDGLKDCAEAEDGIFDQMILNHLNELLNEDLYEHPTPDYKVTILKYINHLVLL
ncbi:MAG: alpha-E domain-containing protein, partial [Bacteroides sp.]|nr:alpha-E domain-containing protein [Bacteroides sp.]